MKKVFSILVLLFLVCNLAIAQQQEWVDKKYNFSSVKNVLVDYEVNEKLKNGISEKETEEFYQEKFFDKLVKKLSSKGYVFSNKKDLPEFSIDANEQRKCYIKDNFDVIINIKLENYTVGSQYADGYTYTFPVTTQNSIYTTNGPVTVTTTSQKTNYVSGGNFPTVLVNVRFDVYDTQTGKAVWSRIDDRSRMNRDEFDNTKPKDVFGRILKDFDSALQKKLKPAIDEE